jgi:WD40 repeat protein
VDVTKAFQSKSPKTPDGKYAVSASIDSTLKVWALKAGD